MNDVTTTNALTMSSLEIAELTGKEHKHVRRDIKRLSEQLNIDVSRFGCNYRDGQNRTQMADQLPKNLGLTLVAGYSVHARKKLIDRLLELEPQTTLNDADVKEGAEK